MRQEGEETRGGEPASRATAPQAVLPAFARDLARRGLELRRDAVETVQVNLGKRCNQTCVHCHVDAGPHRVRENMDHETADRVLALIGATPGLKTVDLTGGAPELNPSFRRIVIHCRALGLEVIDRCNLTVLTEPGQHDLAPFLADHGVHVVASLPCYTAETVEAQRGEGVFARSVEGLQRLNALGYGRDPDKALDLVYNPSGAFLPPPQEALEADYRQRLADDFGIVFTKLLALTNIPVKRFAAYLKQRGELDTYRQLLVDQFNEATVDHLMCRRLVSVSWDGHLFDCDFHQMEELPVLGTQRTIWSITSFAACASGSAGQGAPVRLANHCYGCTAGSGSSCGGVLTTS